MEYTEEAVGRLAFELAEKLCLSAMQDSFFDLDSALDDLRQLDEDVRLGPSTGSIVQAAVARNIPFRRLTDGSLVMFGWGSKQRRIQAAEMDCTSAIAEAIAQDKELTKKLLNAAGVPVPMGRSVDSAIDGWLAALHSVAPASTPLGRWELAETQAGNWSLKNQKGELWTVRHAILPSV